MPAIKWTPEVKQMLITACTDCCKTTEQKKAFLSSDVTVRGEVNERLKEIGKTAIVATFTTRLHSSSKIPKNLRPKLSEGALTQRVTEALCALAKSCSSCRKKDAVIELIEGRGTCTACYCASLDEGHGLKKGTALKAWRASGGRCYLSNLPITLLNAQLDHVQPQAGFPELKTVGANLRFARDFVNIAKGAMDPVEFMGCLKELYEALAEVDFDATIKELEDLKEELAASSASGFFDKEEDESEGDHFYSLSSSSSPEKEAKKDEEEEEDDDEE